MCADKVKDGDIKVGKPLPWSVHDSNGMLLLKKGYVISSQAQLDALSARGMYRDGEGFSQASSKNKYEDANPFDAIIDFHGRVKQIIQGAVKQRPDVNIRMQRFCHDLQFLYLRDIHAMLGAAYMYRHEDSYGYAVQYAVWSQAIAPTLKLSDEQLEGLVQASILGLLLEEAVVNDQVDFSGYKESAEFMNLLAALQLESSFAKDCLQQYVQILFGEEKFSDDSLASWMLLFRLFARLVQPDDGAVQATYPQVIKAMQKGVGKWYTDGLVKIFMNVLGRYPTGSLVLLENGEKAIVTRQTDNVSMPRVASILNTKDAPLVKPMPRKTDESPGKIAGYAALNKPVKLNYSSIWGYF